MKSDAPDDFAGLPGGEMVREGLNDLEQGVLSEFALLVLIAKPRLQALGISVEAGDPRNSGPVEHALYTLLENRFGADGYSRYNSLLRRMTSFAHALERERSASKGGG